MIDRQVSRGVCASGTASLLLMPAQLTAPFSVPKAARAAAAIRSPSAGSATSARTATAALPPPPRARSAATLSAAASSTSAISTRAPRDASSRAQAAPIPEPPPVTRTTRSARSSATWCAGRAGSVGLTGAVGQTGLDLALEHLAGRAERQLGAEHILTRLLVAAELGAGQLAQVGFERRGVPVAPGNHDRDRGLAPFRVRLAHHDHRVDQVVRPQHPLELGRVDVEAARDDHVGLAPGDVQVALGVQPAGVTGEDPFPAERLRGLLRAVPVPPGLRVGPHDDLAGLARGQAAAGGVDDPDLGHRGLAPARALDAFLAREQVAVVLRGQDGELTAGLGQPVALLHVAAEPDERLLDDLLGDRRAAVADPPQAGQGVRAGPFEGG